MLLLLLLCVCAHASHPLIPTPLLFIPNESPAHIGAYALSCMRACMGSCMEKEDQSPQSTDQIRFASMQGC